GLTQEILAERAGLTYKHYQQVEAGRKPDIRLTTLIKIAHALEVEPWQLLKFDLAPVILAEDAVQYGKQAGSAKGARKQPQRRSVAKN
ncbi:MAG: helix-turn-helix domain-containing protein, partial [Cephaloticoccus sp.]|nr:helix-turn-helix domain-containing protein [Cephaloticoccus sp.]